MSLTIRPATLVDAPQMCVLLNAIIEAGGTTALREPFDTARMRADYIENPSRVSCLIAEDDAGLLGFQLLKRESPHLVVPEGWGIIATFVRIGLQGRGVGQSLFEATCAEARKAGVVAIDATIRKENTGGQRFYTKLGFVDYAERPEAISKTYHLG